MIMNYSNVVGQSLKFVCVFSPQEPESRANPPLSNRCESSTSTASGQSKY